MSSFSIVGVLFLNCGKLLKMITQNLNLDLSQATDYLYDSQLYKMLEQEETKVWHYSAEMLYDLLMEEKTNEKIDWSIY